MSPLIITPFCSRDARASYLVTPGCQVARKKSKHFSCHLKNRSLFNFSLPKNELSHIVVDSLKDQGTGFKDLLELLSIKIESSSF